MIRFRRKILLAVALLFASTVRADGPPVASRQAEHEVSIEKNLTIRARDGTRLAADLYRPAHDGKPLPGRFPWCSRRAPPAAAGSR